MAYSSLDNFLGKFVGGARPNRYKVKISGSPTGQVFDDVFTFLCRSASIPASNIGMVEVAYMGRILKISGDKTFDDWTVTVYNDTTWDLRRKFEMWMDGMLAHEENLAGYPAARQYFATAIVEQLDRNERILATYEVKDIFPTSVGAIDLAYDSNDTVETFDVNFAVNWWRTSYTS